MIIKNSAEITLSRRHALGGLSALTLSACGGSDSPSAITSSASSSVGSSSSSSAASSTSSAASSSATSSSTSSASTAYPTACVVSPCTTIGPYPLFANGTADSIAATNSRMYRQNITTSVDAAGTVQLTKTGVPMTINIKVVDFDNGCTPLSGYSVYIWHCDSSGLYSGYSVSNNAGQSGYTYLRGYYNTDSNGIVSFTSIFPGCYNPRWPHIHCVVSLSATQDAVTQFGLPASACAAVYAQSSYSSSLSTYNQRTYDGDQVFGTSANSTLVSNGKISSNQIYLANMTGSVTSGYASYWTIGVTGITASSKCAVTNGS